MQNDTKASSASAGFLQIVSFSSCVAALGAVRRASLRSSAYLIGSAWTIPLAARMAVTIHVFFMLPRCSDGWGCCYTPTLPRTPMVTTYLMDSCSNPKSIPFTAIRACFLSSSGSASSLRNMGFMSSDTDSSDSSIKSSSVDIPSTFARSTILSADGIARPASYDV